MFSKCCCSVAGSCLTLAIPWTAACQNSVSLTTSQIWPKFMSPLNWWCYPTFSSSDALLSFAFPAPGSFPMSWLFASGGQNIGASRSLSVLPVSIQGWFPLEPTRLISLLSKGLSINIYYYFINSQNQKSLWKRRILH